MKIERDGKTYELTMGQLKTAWTERQKQIMIDDMHDRLLFHKDYIVNHYGQAMYDAMIGSENDLYNMAQEYENSYYAVDCGDLEFHSMLDAISAYMMEHGEENNL